MSKKTLDSNDVAAKKRQLRNGLIKLVSIILASFIGVLGAVVGIMYLTGAFDPVVIYPTGIHFEHTLYEPTLTYDEDGNLINYFYIKVLGEPHDLTEKEINLSVGDSYVVTLEKTTANIGEDIKVFITTEDGILPNGGATTITARAGGSGIYGSASCNVFIDRPVTSIEAQTSKKNTANSQSLYINEVINVYEPTFYPARSKNPSKVDENQGDEIVVKPDKSYMYVLEFEFKQPGVDGDVYRWVDVDNLSDPANTESNRVVKWANTEKTQIVALKEGRFRLLCHAFSTYKVQEEEVTEETVEQKKLRMSISDGYAEEQIFTVTEVNLSSIESKNYNNTSTPLDFEYKKEYKLYLRSNSSISQLAANRGYNVDIAINPQSGYGINYTAMYGKVKDVYITTNLQNQDTVIKITGRTVVDENNVTRIYPLLDNEWESFPDNQKEYYYIITVVGKSSNFAFNFHIINPNDGVELTTSVSASISEVQTTEFNFNEGPYTENDLTISIDPNGDHTRNTMKAVIDPDTPFEVDLYDYITNLSADGREPTYDKILFYAYVSNTTETFAENLATISEIIAITTTDQTPFVLAQDRYGILIKDGLLKPIGYGQVTIYAALIQTDYQGNDVQNAVTGTYAIKLASINLSVETILKQVRVQIRENNSDEIVEEDLNENYIYKLVLQPTYDGAPVDYKVLDRVINLIEISFITEEDGIAQVQIDSDFVYDAVSGYHYCLISIPSSSLKDYAKDLQCFVYYNNRLIGSSPQYRINDTAVKSVTMLVESEDRTEKTDYVYKAEVSGGEIIWREIYTDAEGKPAVGGQFAFNVAIDGLNQNYNLTSSDPTSISIYSDNGIQKLRFIKPTNGFVTITCESVENSNIKDSIRIKLEESQFVFEAKNKTISNGEIYENNDTYVETVYKDYKVNVFNLVTVKFNGEVFNNLATLRFSSATNNAILANVDGENGLSTAGDVYFTHNVSSSEYITVEIVTTFGDILRYRFILRNNLAPTIAFKNVSNINSDASMTNQNQAVISEYNGELYMTMVYAQGNTINVKDLIALNHQEDITKVFTNQLIQNDLRFEVATTSGRLISINALTGVITYSNSGLQRVTAPTLINLTMYETDLVDKTLGNIEGNTMRVYNYSFKVLLVPNILVETKTQNMNGEDYTIYQAGKYVFLNSGYDTEYDFEEISGTVQNLEIPFTNFFSIRNFRGDVIDNAVAKYSIPDDSFASLTSTGVLVSPDSLYVSSLLEIGLTYTNYIDYTDSISVTINPYYAIGYNTENQECYVKDGDNEYVLIHVEQKIELYSIITIKNDVTNVKKDALTYQIHQTEYINIRESTNSLSAYINGLKYSKDDYAYVDVYLDGKATGFVVKVKSIENVDFSTYGVNENNISAVLGDKIVVENEVEYWEAFAGQSLDLTEVFIANKYTPRENRLSMIYSFHIYQPESDTYIEDTNNNYIGLTSNNITFKEVAGTTKILIRAKAEEYDEEDGVIPLEFIVEIQKSQGWQWTYPITDNDIHELDFDREHLLSNWNNDLIQGVSKERLENVLFAEGYAYNDVNYRELKPNDTFNISDVLQVYNITKDEHGEIVNIPLSTSEMLEFVNIEFIDYDFDSSSWIVSNHVIVNGNIVTIKDNVSVPTLTFMVVTSDNGMLDVYKLYILTKETVNSKENISIIVAYPTNSSNYYLDETDNKYEHINLDSYNTSLKTNVNADSSTYYGIELTAIPEGGNGTRRISASLNSQDVTSTLRFRIYAEVLNTATNTFSPLSDTYFQPVIIGHFLALTDGRENALPEDTRITVSIYNSYENDFGVYYYLWIGDDLLVNFNVNESTTQLSRSNEGTVENFTYKYRNEFTFTDGNIYNIKDFVTFTRLDGTEITNENIEYYIAEASDFEIDADGNVTSYGDDLTKQSAPEIVLIQDGGKFTITRLAAIDGTAIVIKCKIKLSENVDDYSIVYYPIIVKSSGVESSNPDATVNSKSNPYIVSYNSDNFDTTASGGDTNYTIYNLFNKEGSPATTFIDILSIAELENALGDNLNVEDLVLDLDNFLLSSSAPNLVAFLKNDTETISNIVVPDWLQNKKFNILTGGRKYTFNYSAEKGIEWITIEDPLLVVDNFAYLSRAEIEEVNGEFQITNNYGIIYKKSNNKWLNGESELPNAYESDGYVYYDGEYQEEGKTINVYGVTYTYTEGFWSRSVQDISIPVFSIYVLSDVTFDTMVTLSITPRWKDFNTDEVVLNGPVFNYYVKVVPEYSISVSNASYSQDVYSYHEYDVLSNENHTRFTFSRFNNQTGEYENVDFYNTFNSENPNYRLVVLSEDKTQILDNYSGLLSIEGSNITFKGVLNQEKVCIGIAYDSDLNSEENELFIYPNVYIDFYINLNFTPNDIQILNSNGTINSESNTYSISDDVQLVDVVNISRFVDDSIASAYVNNNGIKYLDILNTFTYASSQFDTGFAMEDILTIKDGVISVNKFFLTAEPYNANIILTLRGVYLTTIYFTVQANYSFSVNGASTTVYVGQQIDLTNLGKSFIGNDGSELVGGEMSFQPLDDDGVTISNGIATFDTVGEYKVLVIYTKLNNTYIGTIDFKVESQYVVIAKEDFVVVNNTIPNSVNDFTTEQKNLLIQDFTFYYEGELMNYPDETEVVINIIATGFSNIKKILITYQGVSAYYYACVDTDKYYYNQNIDEDYTTIPGGNTIDLNQTLDVTYGADGKIINRNQAKDVVYKAVDVIPDTKLEDNLYTSNISKPATEYETREVLYEMQATNGEYYYGLITLGVLPSFKVNAIYNNPSQGITTVAVGESINIHEQISFTMQDGLDNPVLGSSLTNNTRQDYKYKLYDISGALVTTNLPMIDDGNGNLEFTIGALNYTLIVEYSFIYEPKDASNNIIEADVKTLETVYYEILVRGVDYHFVTTNIPTYELYKQGVDSSILNVNNFGYFNITGDSYKFSAVGNYYSIDSNGQGYYISKSNVLYDTECDILITLTKLIGEKEYTFSTIQKFILKQTYNIDYKVDEGNVIKEFARNVFAEYDSDISGGSTKLINNDYYNFNNERIHDMIGLVDSVTISTSVKGESYNYVYNVSKIIDNDTNEIIGYEILPTIDDSSINNIYEIGIVKSDADNSYSLNFYTLYDGENYALDGCSVKFLIKFKAEDQTKFIDFTISYDTTSDAGEFNFNDGQLKFDYNKTTIELVRDDFTISDVEDVKIIASTNVPQLSISGVIEYYTSETSSNVKITITAQRLYGVDVEGEIYFDLYNLQTNSYVDNCWTSVKILANDIKLSNAENLNYEQIYSYQEVHLNSFIYNVNSDNSKFTIYDLNTVYKIYDYTGNLVSDNSKYINVDQDKITFNRSINGDDFTLVIDYIFTLHNNAQLDNFKSIKFTKVYEVLAPTYELSVEGYTINDNLITLNSNEINVRLLAKYKNNITIAQIITNKKYFTSSNIETGNVIEGDSGVNKEVLNIKFKSVGYSTYVRVVLTSTVNGYTIELPLDISIPTTVSADTTTNINLNKINEIPSSRPYVTLSKEVESIEVFDITGNVLENTGNSLYVFNEGIKLLTLKAYNYIYAVKLINTNKYNGATSYYYEYYTLVDENTSTTVTLQILKGLSEVNGFYLEYEYPNKKVDYTVNYSNSTSTGSWYTYRVESDSSYFTASFNSNTLSLTSKSKANYLDYLTIKVYSGISLVYEREFEVYGSSDVFDVSGDNAKAYTINIADDYTADTYKVDLTKFTTAGYTLTTTNADKVSIDAGIVTFDVPYLVYKVSDNGNVTLDSKHNKNSYETTITASKESSNINLKFTVTTNKTSTLSNYTINSLPTKIKMLDDIKVTPNTEISTDLLKYNGSLLRGSIEFIALNNINYKIDNANSKLTIKSVISESYCLVKCSNEYYLQKLIPDEKYFEGFISLNHLQGTKIIDEDGIKLDVDVSERDSFIIKDDLSITNLIGYDILSINITSSAFKVDGVENTDPDKTTLDLPIPVYSYSIDSNGNLVEVAPEDYNVTLSVLNPSSGNYMNFVITIRNDYTCKDSYTNASPATLSDISTDGDGKIYTSNLTLTNNFVYNNTYVDENGKLKGTVSFIGQSGAQNKLSANGDTMTFYNAGTYNVVVKQIVNGGDKYYVVKVNANNVASKSSVTKVEVFKYSNDEQYVYTIENDTTTVATVINAALGAGTYNSSTFEILSSSVSINSGVINFTESDFDKYAYIHAYCSTNNTFYVIKLYRKSSGMSISANNTIEITQSNNTTDFNNQLQEIDIYNAFNALSEGENTNISNILQQYIRYQFSRRAIVSIDRSGNTFVITQKGVRDKEFTNTVVLRRSIKVITNTYTLKASTVFNGFKGSDLHTPVSGSNGVTINADKSISFKPVLTDTEVFIKVVSKVIASATDNSVNVQYVKFILLADVNSYTNLIKDFEIVDVVKGGKYELKFTDTSNYQYSLKGSNDFITKYTFNADGSYGYVYKDFVVKDVYGNTITLTKVFNIITEKDVYPVVFKQMAYTATNTSVDLNTIVSVVDDGDTNTPQVTPKFTIKSIDSALSSGLNATGKGEVKIVDSILYYDFYHFNDYNVTLVATVGSVSFEFNLILKGNINKDLFKQGYLSDNIDASGNIVLFSDFDKTPMVNTLNISVRVTNSQGVEASYTYNKGNIQLNALDNGNYIVYVTMFDACNVAFNYNLGFTVDEATSQTLQYISNNVVINAGETLTLTKDGDTEANTHIGVFKLLAATIEGVELSEVVLNDLAYMTFELRYNGNELTIVDLQSIEAGHVLYDTTVQVEVALGDGINIYIGYLNVTILGDYMFENKVQDNFRVDFETDFMLADLLTVRQNKVDITSTLNSTSDLATTVEIVDYNNKELSTDIVYDEETQIFRVTSDASGNVYIVRLKFATNNQVKVIEVVVNVNEKTYSFNFKTDIYTMYSGESVNLNDLAGQFIDSDGFIIPSDIAPKLTFALENAQNIPFVTLDQNNRLTSNSILETTTIRVRVSQGENYIGYLNVTILPHYETSISVDNNVLIENNIIKLKVDESVILRPQIIDILDSGYATNFTIECKLNGVVQTLNDGVYTFTPDKEFLGKTSTVEFIISVKYGGVVYQSITLTQQIYTYNRVMKFIGTNNVINEAIINEGFDIATLFEFYYENDLNNKVEINPNDYNIFFNSNNGSIELTRNGEFTDITYNNNTIGYKLDGNILTLDVTNATSNILLSMQIVDRYTGNSITYTCIIVCA